MSEVIHDVSIIPFDDQYIQDFARLNRDWLEQHSLLEEADKHHLDAPFHSIIAPGGEIFFALEKNDVVGTCAAVRHSKDHVEIAKLAVTPDAQGNGIGRLLTEAVITYARHINASKISLVSNARLKAALRLYESVGFEYAPLPANTKYASADIYMELHFDKGRPLDGKHH